MEIDGTVDAGPHQGRWDLIPGVRERLRTSANFLDEHGSKSRSFVFVVPRRVVEFALGQFVKGDAQRSDPALRLSKHFVCRPA